jgi:hypothetical protein
MNSWQRPSGVGGGACRQREKNLRAECRCANPRWVVMGNKPKLTHHQRQQAMARREAGEALVDIARSYNVSHSTISRL